MILNQEDTKRVFPEKLVKKCLRFSRLAYDGLSAFRGYRMIKHSSSNLPFKPMWYCFKDGNNTFIAIRGTSSKCDCITDACCFEKNAVLNGRKVTFHCGFYLSALFIFKNLMENFNEMTGNIYITGHSLGASVATILCVLLKEAREFKRRIIKALCYAPAPCMSNYRNDLNTFIASFVNENDIVPTACVKNAYKLIEPFMKVYSLLSNARGGLETILLLLPRREEIEQLFNEITNINQDGQWNLLDIMFKSPKFSVEKISGTIFHMRRNGDSIYNSVESPVGNFDRLSIGRGALKNHSIYLYDNIIYELAPDQ